MTELIPADADAELRAVLDLLDNGGRHCGCDPDLYGDSDFIGMVSDSHGRNHQEVRGAAIRALLAERDQLRDRLAAVRGATEEWRTFALGYRDDPNPAAQAAWRAMAHSLCCVLTALDGEPADAVHPLGVVEFPQDVTDEEMTRWAAAWEAAQGPERPLTLDLGNRTATFRTKPWPAEHDAVARETAEQTPPSGTIDQ